MLNYYNENNQITFTFYLKSCNIIKIKTLLTVATTLFYIVADENMTKSILVF